MSSKIFFVGRFVPYTVTTFNGIRNIVSKKSDIEIDFLGPDEKNVHWLSYQTIDGAKKVWSYGNYVRRLSKYIKNPRTFKSGYKS